MDEPPCWEGLDPAWKSKVQQYTTQRKTVSKTKVEGMRNSDGTELMCCTRITPLAVSTATVSDPDDLKLQHITAIRCVYDGTLRLMSIKQRRYCSLFFHRLGDIWEWSRFIRNLWRLPDRLVVWSRIEDDLKLTDVVIMYRVGQQGWSILRLVKMLCPNWAM